MKDADKTDYFAKRGLTAETVKKFCLGFDVHRNAVVLPYSSELTYYQTRCIADKKFYKPPTEEAGTEPLFNRKALWASDKEPVFVVESPICALSVMQCGGLAVSLCGVGGTSKLVKDCKIKSRRRLSCCAWTMTNRDRKPPSSSPPNSRRWEYGMWSLILPENAKTRTNCSCRMPGNSKTESPPPSVR